MRACPQTNRRQKHRRWGCAWPAAMCSSRSMVPAHHARALPYSRTPTGSACRDDRRAEGSVRNTPSGHGQSIASNRKADATRPYLGRHCPCPEAVRARLDAGTPSKSSQMVGLRRHGRCGTASQIPSPASGRSLDDAGDRDPRIQSRPDIA